jgi:nucleoside-diphosphate-sugar epimerase
VTGAILVTGANGFVGRAIVDRLVADGRSVRAAVRRPEGDMPEGVAEVAMADLGAAQDWPALLTGVDCIVHCAARAHILKDDAADPLALFRQVNTQATLDMARAAAASGVRRFVFVSSIGVNGGETKGRAFRHDDAPHPHSDYAIAKQEAEEGLTLISREAGLEVVIIRPPLVLGQDAKGNLGLLAKVVRKGLPLPLGSVTGNRRDLVSLDTLASLVSTCIDHPAAAGETFLVSDGVSLSTRQIVDKIGGFVGFRPRFLPMPKAFLGLGLKIIGRGGLASQLLGDLEVDIGHTRKTLGWAPPTGH